METVTAEMKVVRIIRQCPEAAEVFLGRGCPDMRSGFFYMMAHVMSVRNAARIHKIELDPLLEDLNKLVQYETGKQQY